MNTLEFVLAFVLEPEVRSGNQVDNSPRDADLTWFGAALHALSQMHGYAGHVVAAAFDFARVKAGPNLQPQLLECFPDCASALHGSCRAVEDSKDAVTSVLHQVSSISAKLALNDPVVAFEEFLPRVISEGGRALSGADDVSEEH